MPTLVEYLATLSGRFYLLSENYTLHNTQTDDYLNISKIEAFSMPDSERFLSLIRDNDNWEILDEKMNFTEAVLYLRGTGLAVQTDLNSEVYLRIASSDIVPERFQFYNKSDDTETDIILLPDLFVTRNWTIYILP